ncbi:MAG: hypothetical protein ACOYMH_15740, partial [Zwartia sp.]
MPESSSRVTFQPPLALTLGDAAGIGPEIIVKLHDQGLPAACVVYGDPGALSRAVDLLNQPLRIIELATIDEIHHYTHATDCIFVRPTHLALP